jgi:hypothetical protein
MSLFSAIGQRVKDVGLVLNAAFNPFSKSTVDVNVSNPALKKVLTTLVEHPYVSAGVVATGITAITNPAVIGSALKSIIPSTAKGKVLTVLAAPVVAGAVINQPGKTADLLINAPSSLSNFGGNVANFAANPTIENIKTIIAENPLISGGVAAGVVIAGASAIIPAITTSRYIGAVNEQTEAIREQTASNLTSSGVLVGSSTQYASETPITPATQTVQAGGTRTSTSRKKRSSKAIIPSVSQKINVVVSNRANSTGIKQTKRYLNNRILN